MFVPLASVSNIAKNVSWLATGATRAAINKTFAIKDNLGDLTAKSGAQATAAGLMGTGLGVVLSYLMPSAHPFSLVLAFLPIAVINTYAIYVSCTVVVTRTLDAQRAELALSPLVDALLSGRTEHVIPKPEEVSQFERFAMPTASKGLLLEPALDSPDLTNFALGAGHVVATSPKGACLWLDERASDAEACAGFLRVLVLRKLLQSGTAPEQAVAQSADLLDSFCGVAKLKRTLHEAGWDTENHFLCEKGARLKFDRW